MTVVNGGCLAAGSGVAVDLIDETDNVFASASSPEALGAGASVRLEVRQARGQGFQARLRAVVDPAGQYNECVEDNNASAEVDVSCQTGF